MNEDRETRDVIDRSPAKGDLIVDPDTKIVEEDAPAQEVNVTAEPGSDVSVDIEKEE